MKVTGTGLRIQVSDLGEYEGDAFIGAAVKLGARWKRRSRMLSFPKHLYRKAAESLNAQFGCNMPWTFIHYKSQSG